MNVDVRSLWRRFLAWYRRQVEYGRGLNDPPDMTRGSPVGGYQDFVYRARRLFRGDEEP